MNKDVDNRENIEEKKDPTVVSDTDMKSGENFLNEEMVDINSKEADEELEELKSDMGLTDKEISPFFAKINEYVTKFRTRNPNEPELDEYEDNVDKYANKWRFGTIGKIVGVFTGTILAVAGLIGSAVRSLVFGNSQAYSLKKDMNDHKMKKDVKKQIKESQDGNKKQGVKKEEMVHSKEENKLSFYQKQEVIDFLKIYNAEVQKDVLILKSGDDKFKLSIADLNEKTNKKLAKIIYQSEKSEYNSQKDRDINKLKAVVKSSMIIAGLKILENQKLVTPENLDVSKAILTNLTLHTADISSNVRIEIVPTPESVKNGDTIDTNINLVYNGQKIAEFPSNQLNDSQLLKKINSSLEEVFNSIYSKKFSISIGSQNIVFKLEDNNSVSIADSKGKEMGTFQVKTEKDIGDIIECLRSTNHDKIKNKSSDLKQTSVAYIIGCIANPSLVSSYDANTEKYYNPLINDYQTKGSAHMSVVYNEQGVSFKMNTPEEKDQFGSKQVAYIKSVNALNDKSLQYIVSNIEKAANEMVIINPNDEIKERPVPQNQDISFDIDMDIEDEIYNQELIDKMLKENDIQCMKMGSEEQFGELSGDIVGETNIDSNEMQINLGSLELPDLEIN